MQEQTAHMCLFRHIGLWRIRTAKVARWWSLDAKNRYCPVSTSYSCIQESCCPPVCQIWIGGPNFKARGRTRDCPKPWSQYITLVLRLPWSHPACIAFIIATVACGGLQRTSSFHLNSCCWSGHACIPLSGASLCWCCVHRLSCIHAGLCNTPDVLDRSERPLWNRDIIVMILCPQEINTIWNFKCTVYIHNNIWAVHRTTQ